LVGEGWGEGGLLTSAPSTCQKFTDYYCGQPLNQIDGKHHQFLIDRITLRSRLTEPSLQRVAVTAIVPNGTKSRKIGVSEFLIRRVPQYSRR
jgi:hypothetical protein